MKKQNKTKPENRFTLDTQREKRGVTKAQRSSGNTCSRKHLRSGLFIKFSFSVSQGEAHVSPLLPDGTLNAVRLLPQSSPD